MCTWAWNVQGYQGQTRRCTSSRGERSKDCRQSYVKWKASTRSYFIIVLRRDWSKKTPWSRHRCLQDYAVETRRAHPHSPRNGDTHANTHKKGWLLFWRLDGSYGRQRFFLSCHVVNCFCHTWKMTRGQWNYRIIFFFKGGNKSARWAFLFW